MICSCYLKFWTPHFNFTLTVKSSLDFTKVSDIKKPEWINAIYQVNKFLSALN